MHMHQYHLAAAAERFNVNIVIVKQDGQAILIRPEDRATRIVIAAGDEQEAVVRRLDEAEAGNLQQDLPCAFLYNTIGVTAAADHFENFDNRSLSLCNPGMLISSVVMLLQTSLNSCSPRLVSSQPSSMTRSR